MSCKEITEKNSFDRIISRVKPWLPANIVEQLKSKKTLTPVEIIRLLSILPSEAYDEFPDIPNQMLKFPKDHNFHYLQSDEWFYLALNLFDKSNNQRIGALSSIVRHSIDSYNSNGLFAPISENEVFRSSFSITTSDNHWYFDDQGGYLGVAPENYEPGILNSLPFLLINKKKGIQGLLPPSDSSYDLEWKISDETKNASIDVKLTCKAPILLQGQDANGTITLSGTGVNYLYYSLPYFTISGSIQLPNEKKPREVTGTAWLDHQGGVVKSASGMVGYLLSWVKLFGHNPHRLAWIWVQAQFPSVNTFITGSAIGINPQEVSKGKSFPWFGTVMTNGKSKFYKSGKLVVKDIFKSPDLNVRYVIDLDVTVGDNISFSLKSIYADQRVFPADQGEIYEGASDALLNGKTSGYGFIENMAFSSYHELVQQQYKKLGISGSTPAEIKNLTGPIITIVVFVLIVILVIWLILRRRKKSRRK